MNLTLSHIILASGSPRRLEILRAHGIEPEVVLSTIDEDAHIASLAESLTPEELAVELALAKARAVLELQQSLSSRDSASSVFILAADTIVYKEGIGNLGKPADKGEALTMLRALSGTSHQVITGVALMDACTGEARSFADVTTVTFDAYDIDEIEHYLAVEPPFDKAGSYAIQGYWGKHVVAVEGDLENVIGLPFYRIEALLKA